MYIQVLKFMAIINVFSAYPKNIRTPRIVGDERLNYSRLADTGVYIWLTNKLCLKARPFTAIGRSCAVRTGLETKIHI